MALLPRRVVCDLRAGYDRSPMSFALGIEVTRACNFRCRHCFVDAGPRAPAGASREQLEALIRQAALCRVDSIGWSGGEPLIRKDLARLTACATGYGMRVGLASNGYLASRRRLEALREAGLTVLQVSLDAPDPERAGRYRQGPRGHVERALAALRTGVELGLATYLCTILAPESLSEAGEMIALARSLGLAGLRYTTWAPVGRASGGRYDEPAWSGPPLATFSREVERALEAGGLEVLIDCPTGPLPFRPRHHCGAGRETAYVTAEGDLYPCTALIFPEYRVGNVFREGFDRLFDDARIFRVLREIARRPVGGSCRGCALVDWCRGGCPGRAIAEHGAIGRPRRHAMPACLYRLGRMR